MSIHPAVIVGVYLIIGIFIASAIKHGSNEDSDFTMFVLFTLFWPIVLGLLAILAVVCIPYILGKWVGNLIHDLLR